MEEVMEKACDTNVNYGYYANIREFEVNIKTLTRGVVVSVGCKSFAFADIDEALKEVNNWYKNPKETVEKYKEFLDL